MRKRHVTQELNKRIEKLNKLKQKRFKYIQSITLSKVSLGDLRRRYKPRHSPLHPAILRSVPKFTRLPSNDYPVLIYGSDGGLLACRVPLNRPELIEHLSNTIDHLDKFPPKHYKYKGITRSEYKTRHLGIWCSYMKEPKYTKEHRDHQAAHN